jgi:hypothetical protein
MVFFEIARIVGQTVLSLEKKDDGTKEKVKLDHSSTQTDEELRTVVSSRDTANNF